MVNPNISVYIILYNLFQLKSYFYIYSNKYIIKLKKDFVESSYSIKRKKLELIWTNIILIKYYHLFQLIVLY